LLEAGYRPDLLIGTSIGAINAAGLALWGVDLAGVDALARSTARRVKQSAHR
jgi:predicted acylesterase/phospholipase RssA